ncbi:uncharacterized protein [Nicotiana tomentosiformis]|uniref:uncharacterized protein n=1 Tax=Nicotiana tomentosiformis TaxID=4098 RepID=UPI00051C22F1|nr:uncharacterized protein LOC104105788 [Nicotiana tomentosiformis]
MSCHPVSFSEVKDFSDCINATLLNELQWKDEYFTWSNKQQGSNRVSSKIDRAFGNCDWMMMWGHIVLEYDLPNISKHAPMLLTLQSVNHSIKAPFRFFNIWSEHAKFLELIDVNWKKQLDRDPMQNVWNKLKDLRLVFRQLNQREFQSISLKTEKARKELQCILAELVARYDDSLVIKEKEALMNLQKWNLLGESILRQKSRAQWIQLGDSNSKYFAAVMKERSQRKQIMELNSLSGAKLTDLKELRDEIVSFYKG